jgi:hypothetical protein
MAEEFGPQPIGEVMRMHGVTPAQVVAATDEQLTFKVVSKACKGRRLTPHMQDKLTRALNAVLSASYASGELFTYR